MFCLCGLCGALGTRNFNFEKSAHREERHSEPLRGYARESVPALECVATPAHAPRVARGPFRSNVSDAD